MYIILIYINNIFIIFNDFEYFSIDIRLMIVLLNDYFICNIYLFIINFSLFIVKYSPLINNRYLIFKFLFVNFNVDTGFN